MGEDGEYFDTYSLVFLNLLKCALRNQSLKAHYKAGNIFEGFFLATWGQRLLGASGV